MFGLILACAFAADTPTIIAKTLKPPIKARFIRTPPFRQENATLFIGSINNNKIKEADGRGRPIFGAVPGKSSSTPPHLLPALNPAADDFGGSAFVHGGATASVNNRRAFAGARSPGPPAGPLPARVRIAEAAVARNHLLHAHLEGWDGAILVHDPSADIRQCAPRPLVGLAYARVQEHGRSRGGHDEHPSHD